MITAMLFATKAAAHLIALIAISDAFLDPLTTSTFTLLALFTLITAIMTFVITLVCSVTSSLLHILFKATRSSLSWISHIVPAGLAYFAILDAFLPESLWKAYQHEEAPQVKVEPQWWWLGFLVCHSVLRVMASSHERSEIDGGLHEEVEGEDDMAASQEVDEAEATVDISVSDEETTGSELNLDDEIEEEEESEVDSELEPSSLTSLNTHLAHLLTRRSNLLRLKSVQQPATDFLLTQLQSQIDLFVSLVGRVRRLDEELLGMRCESREKLTRLTKENVAAGEEGGSEKEGNVTDCGVECSERDGGSGSGDVCCGDATEMGRREREPHVAKGGHEKEE
ncbi:hypothetical protein HK102_011508 [Quaeritorhiza haematococci]|nr:hypothetical protein HK102_011508 [Quaeritorhiza haematococci]